MKRLLPFCFLSIFIMSCSSDDDSAGGTIDRNDYFPVTPNAVWFYDFNQMNQGVNQSGNMIVDINGYEYFDNEAYQILDNTTYLIGGMNQLFFKKSLDKEIVIRPMIDFMGNFADFDDLNFILNSMSRGAVLDETNKEIIGETMMIPQNTSGITGTVTPKTSITIRNRHIDKSNQMTVQGINYQSITHQRIEYDIQMILEIDADLIVGSETVNITRQHELVGQQQYGELNVYLAKDVGIIKTEYDYSFRDLEMNSNINFGGISMNIADFAPEILDFNNAVHMQGNASLNDISL